MIEVGGGSCQEGGMCEKRLPEIGSLTRSPHTNLASGCDFERGLNYQRNE